MSSDTLGLNRFTIDSLLHSGIIIAHKDGNYGSLYPRVNDFGLVGVPFITAKSLNDGRIDIAGAPRLAFDKAKKFTYGFVKPGDVLLSHNATIGRVAVVPNFDGEMLVGTSLTYYRVDETKLIPHYLAAFFSSIDFQNQLKAVMGLSTRNQVPITAQRKLSIVIPPIEKQRFIAETLGIIDSRISVLRETNITLEAIAGATFKSWFVDFDAVRAKAEGLDPVGMDAATAALFPDSLEESELGLVPKGWATRPIYDMASYINGAAYKAFEPNAERRGLPIIKIAELKSGVTSQTAFSDAVMPEKYLIKTGDILFSWSGNPDTSIDTFVWGHDPALLNQHIFRVLPHIPTERSFVLQTLRNLKPIFTELARNKQTTGLGHVTVADLKRLHVVHPPVSVIEQFNNIAETIHQMIFGNEQQAQTLTQLRDTLLPRLISGQLRLPEAKALAKAANL
jgi:type I restriction enzyme S subunit